MVSVSTTIVLTIVGLLAAFVGIVAKLSFNVGKLTAKVEENAEDVRRNKKSADERFAKNEAALNTTNGEMKKREIAEGKMQVTLSNMEMMIRELKQMVAKMTGITPKE